MADLFQLSVQLHILLLEQGSEASFLLVVVRLARELRVLRWPAASLLLHSRGEFPEGAVLQLEQLGILLQLLDSQQELSVLLEQPLGVSLLVIA